MNNRQVSYHIGENGEFIVRNYNLARPFSGFFPGIAGLYGKPMWAFYANRSQGICSMGIGSKDGAILEFQSANKAYVLTSTHGFRTFLRINKDGALHFYEPFTESSNYDRENLISIGSSDLYLEEKNHTLGIEINVRYFCVPNEPFSALARELTIRNNNNSAINVEIIDGLPFIMPYGLTERLTKDMSHTIQAWMHVANLDKKMPFYKLKAVVADKPVVTKVEEGNFYLGYHFIKDAKAEIITPIVDPAVVFSNIMDLRMPYNFFRQDNFQIPQEQISEGITPSGFGYLKFAIDGHSDKKLFFMIGNTDNELLKKLPHIVMNKEYFGRKHDECGKCISELQENMSTESSSYQLNIYCKNTFVDNVLRGGYPVTLRDGGEPKVLHLYSRRHGDVERDYNKFLLLPTYYSQGDGNYRDVCQNRRNDGWFNPDILDDNIKTFVNLIQLDGYNPLQLKGDRFIIRKVPKELTQLKDFLKKPFMLGELLDYIEKSRIKLEIDNEQLIKIIVSNSDKDTKAEFKEGYWIDHWTYIADLLESYRSIYPDLYWKIFNKKEYTYFDSPAVVMPKKKKIVTRDGKIRQYGSVVEDEKKHILISSRQSHPNKMRVKYGKGNIYKTTLIAKLVTLITNKFASLDPFGIGIEMEADRPGWYDALNGLPGLFGSSTCETFELKRLILMVNEALSNLYEDKIALPVETANFLFGLFRGINQKENYREKTKFGISGKEKNVPIRQIIGVLYKFSKVLDEAIKKAFDSKCGLYHTYFINEVVSMNPIKYKQKPLPHFLEAQVHALRLIPGIEKAKELYNAVKRNGLYDEKLKMYKVNASLKDESIEIGRVKVFSPGWLENESIWVHMEYKYLLELLRNDLHEEFYNDFRNVLIPFQNPNVFGRSIVESCSFIVSSAHPDKSLHGIGFLPRLTGATAEFIHIWLWMCLGKRPFFINSSGELNMQFKPVLADWLFTQEGTFAFNLLGTIRVIYHNPKKKNTFGANAVKPFKIMLDSVTIEGDVVPAPYAEQVRQRKIKRIDVYLG